MRRFHMLRRVISYPASPRQNMAAPLVRSSTAVSVMTCPLDAEGRYNNLSGFCWMCPMHLLCYYQCIFGIEQMNFRQLRTFIAVADAGGFTRATGRLNLSQSAASRQILALEAELGVRLFDRIDRRMQLTSEGEDLLQRSRRLLADSVSLGERARALKGGQVGVLRVGAPTQVIENLLAPFVMQYQRSHPGVEVHLLEAAAARLQRHLERGD